MSEINQYFSSSVDDILMLRRMCHSIRLLHTTFHEKTGKCVSNRDTDQYCSLSV